MRFLRKSVQFPTLLIAVVCVVIPKVNAGEKTDGIVAGWDRFDGRLLLGELNCVACHSPSPLGGEGGVRGEEDRVLQRQPPILSEVGKRITPQFLRTFLSDPHKGKANTPMPDLLHGLDATQRGDAVDKLVHYLVSLGGPMDQLSSGGSEFQIERGKILFHTVGCVACHEPLEVAPERKSDLPAEILELIKGKVKPLPSVPFSDLSSKTTVDELTNFLRDPLHVRPSGRMPSLSLDLGDARCIAAYLLRDQLTKDKKGLGPGLDFAFYQGAFPKVPDFEKLTPKKEGQTKGFDLLALPLNKGTLGSNFAVRIHGIIDIPDEGKYTFWTASDDGSVLKIDGKVVVNNDGIHAPAEKSGSVELTKGRHAIEVGFIQGGGGFELSVQWQPPPLAPGGRVRETIPTGLLLHGAYAMIPKGVEDFRIDNTKAAAGKELFANLGCASCHQTGDKDMKKVAGLSLTKVNPESGCLGDKLDAKLPKFGFNQKQREALRQALLDLKKDAKPLTVAERIDQTMTAYSCYACHTRNEKGGPDARREGYFGTLVPADLGEEGRMPPHLDIVGAKLTKVGFDGYLLQGKRVRQAMGTRMPLFGQQNIGHLPDAFVKVDAGKIPQREPQFSTRHYDDGRQLVGKKGLACISCHAWGIYQVTGADGLDLQTMTQRLQPGWFHAWLENPNKLRSQTRMPTAWPDGKSFFPNVQDGDMRKQIDVIWAYLSLGNKGAPPDGLIAGDEYVLTPTDEPILFRTFVGGVGAHAIAVGFPQRTHYVFDALRIRTAKTWTGFFIDARAAWEGRAGRYADIAGDVVEMPAGSPFAMLDSRAAPWPVMNMKSKAPPEGWRFLGYSYDDKRVPTFRYAFNGIEIEEKPSTEYRQSQAYLRRSFHLTSKENVGNLYFRAAAGKKIVADSSGGFVVDDRLHYHFGSPNGVEPVIRSVENGQELLVPIRFKGDNAELDVDLLW